MKPKTKEQEKIVKLSHKCGGLTPRQEAYAKRHCFTEYILESRGTCVCTACKHTWHIQDTSTNELKCPHCGKTLKVIHHSRKINLSSYFAVLTTKANIQVVMWYQVERAVSKTEDKFTFTCVGSEWITAKGKRYCISLRRFAMFYGREGWIKESEMELREKNVFAKAIWASAVFVTRVLPLVKRNGFKRTSELDWAVSDVIYLLLNNSAFESWFKVGHYGVCYEWIALHMSNPHIAKQDWAMTSGELTLIKLANRKHVVFDTLEKWRDYQDYIKDLVYMNQDIHNPKILFPDNFQAVHQELSERADRKRQRDAEIIRRQRNIEQMERKAKKDSQIKAWVSKYAQCFGNMRLTSGNFTILPLVSIHDFENEAAHMHHCIATYYGKLDTLLLSIEHDNNKCETAEISLVNGGHIVQCRGVNNQPSEFHNDILDILKGFMTEFIRRFNKPVAQPTLPVPMSFYRQFQIAI